MISPLFHRDSRGYYQGFHYDLVEEVCKAAKINCTTVLEPYSHCISPEYFGGEGEHSCSSLFLIYLSLKYYIVYEINTTFIWYYLYMYSALVGQLI